MCYRKPFSCGLPRELQTSPSSAEFHIIIFEKPQNDTGAQSVCEAKHKNQEEEKLRSLKSDYQTANTKLKTSRSEGDFSLDLLGKTTSDEW